MESISELSAGHIFLLTIHYASESKIEALRALAAERIHDLNADLLLRIVLSYLPESADPTIYTKLVGELTRGLYAERAWVNEQQFASVDTSSVKELSVAKAAKRAKRVAANLLQLEHPSCPSRLCNDTLTQFLIHRAHRIDTQIGVLTLIPQLIDPFLERSEYLQKWYISTVLPLLRLGYEYHPTDHVPLSLDKIELVDGEQGVSFLLSRVADNGETDSGGTALARDFRGLVGPWMYGYDQRKMTRPKPTARRRGTMTQELALETDRKVAEQSDRDHPQGPGTGHDWDYAFKWMARTSAQKFPLVAEAIDDWDGPSDVDLGGYHEGPYLPEELQQQLHHRFVQAAFAAAYTAETDSRETVSRAHGLLVRIAHLMDYIPPPDLATSVGQLPHINDDSPGFKDLAQSHMNAETLLRHGHPLTVPSLQTYAFLQLLIFSAYTFADIGLKMAIVDVARLRFQHGFDEQYSNIQKILHTLSTGVKKDEQQWITIRHKLIWLWNWNMDNDDTVAQFGSGPLGRVDRATLEKEILKALLNAACYPLVISTYVRQDYEYHRLSTDDVEEVIIAVAMNHYDNASNGNRTRGGMRKASDIISTLRKYFPGSEAFRRCEALLAATHALSFYSLTLQHGVPFLPVNIRVSSDPISLIEKLLSQNPHSYTNLDDLITISQNLVSAGLVNATNTNGSGPTISPSAKILQTQKHTAERRVIGLAIEAALNEDDFETAYSYVVNKLDTTRTSPSQTTTDDISWRAALAAGRHKSSSSTYSASTNLATPPILRRLEQRMELLSQALLLAPPSALPEVLNVWRKCEEEMLALAARELAEEESFNDYADKGVLPGSFVNSTLPVQERREVGRGSKEEAPMGLFDVARGAAAAFSKSAFPLRGAAAAAASSEGDAANVKVRERERPVSMTGSDAGSVGSDGLKEGERVRKRDVIASTVTGGLASGIGWVLGAKPVDQQGAR
ncbi:secretory pathway Sec39 [Tothia fuscella]|uniref:Secretory pathway Sec39 n=1 Tax=Tothia fuscella TaxID=1048955 RepID=A0A9P4NEF0_9PEZI|nr:secretory pathway Sec39 [Tothia fuscella]